MSGFDHDETRGANNAPRGADADDVPPAAPPGDVGAEFGFDDEVGAAAALDHPNIVTVYGSEEIDGQPVLVMKWIEGLPFDRWSEGEDAGLFETVLTAQDYQATF